MIQVSKGQKVTAQHENEQSNLIDQLNKRINKVGYDSVSQEYFEEKNQPAFTIKLVDFASAEDLTSQYVFFNTLSSADKLFNYNQQFIPFCLISQVPQKKGFQPEINFGNEIYSFAKSLSDDLSSEPVNVDASLIFISADGQYYYTLANEDDIKNADAEIIQKFRIANLRQDETGNDVIQQVHAGIITYSTDASQIIPDTQYSKQYNLGKYGQYSIENRLVTTEISDGLSVDTVIQQLHEFDNDDSFKKNAKQDDYFYGLSAKDVLVRLNKPCACSDTNGQMLSYLPLSDMMAVGDSQLSDLNLSSIYVCQDAVCQDRVEIYCFKDAFKDGVSSLGKRCFCTAVDSQLRPVLAYKGQEDSAGINAAYIPFTDYGIPNDKHGIENKGFTLPRNITSYANLTIGSPDNSSNPTIIFSHPSQPISVKNKLNKILYLRDDSSVGFADLSTSISGTGGGDIVSAGNYITINETVTEDDQTVKVINGASINLVQCDYDCGQAQITYIYSKDNNQHNICYQPSFQNIHGVKACSGNREVNFCAPCGGLYIYGDDTGKIVNFIPQIYTTTPKSISVWQSGCTIMIDYLSGCGGGGGGDIGCYVRTLNCLTGDVVIRGEGVSVITNTWNNGITISAPAPHCGYSKIGSIELSNTYGNLLVRDNFGDTCTNDFVPLKLHAYKCTYTKTDIIELSTVGVKQALYVVNDLCKSEFCYNICNYSMLEGHYLSSSNLCIDIDYQRRQNGNGQGCLTTMINIPDKFPSSWVLLGEDSSSYPVIMQQLKCYQIEFKYNKISTDIFTEKGQSNVLLKENTGGPIQLYVDKMPNTLYTQQYAKTAYTATCPATISSTGFGWQLGARGMLGAACTIHDSVYWSGTDLVVDYGPLKRQIETCIGSSTVVTEEIERQISVILSNVLSNYVDKTYLSANAWLQNCYQTNKAEPAGIRIGSTQLTERQLQCLLNLI